MFLILVPGARFPLYCKHGCRRTSNLLAQHIEICSHLLFLSLSSRRFCFLFFLREHSSRANVIRLLPSLTWFLFRQDSLYKTCFSFLSAKDFPVKNFLTVVKLFESSRPSFSCYIYRARSCRSPYLALYREAITEHPNFPSFFNTPLSSQRYSHSHSARSNSSFTPLRLQQTRLTLNHCRLRNHIFAGHVNVRESRQIWRIVDLVCSTRNTSDKAAGNW